MRRDEYILYGLKKHNEVIDEIVSSIETIDDNFDIRLILTEALSNAFKHGNKNSVDKPIYLRAIHDDRGIKFEIEDSGDGFGDIVIPEQISDDNLLNNYGRGLFLIKAIADEVEFRNNTLIIYKTLIINKDYI